MFSFTFSDRADRLLFEFQFKFLFACCVWKIRELVIFDRISQKYMHDIGESFGCLKKFCDVNTFRFVCIFMNFLDV